MPEPAAAHADQDRLPASRSQREVVGGGLIPTRYGTFAEAPPHLKSRSRWKRCLRKVKPTARPEATIAACDPKYDIGLYPESATSPYQPTPVTLARWRYFDTFVYGTQGDSRIYWDRTKRNPGSGLLGGWTTHRDRLRDADIGRHINAKEVFGVRAASSGAVCRFVDIDLDCHPGADRDLFLRMFEALVVEFTGENAFHVEVADRDAQGAHLRQVFRRAYKVEQALKLVRERLLKLERQHPGLTEEAVSKGHKTFSKLEVFPNESSGVRLPLCAGRAVLLGTPLPRVFKTRLKREVADVVGFMRWVDDESRAYMGVSAVVEYVSQRLSITTVRKASVTPQARDEPKIGEKEERASIVHDVSDSLPNHPPPLHGDFELAQRQLYPSLAEIAVKGLVPLTSLRLNGKVPKSSALATVCVHFAMALWHEEMSHLPGKERHLKITNLLVERVFSRHNGVCSRLNKTDPKVRADVVKQIYNCVNTASKSEDHQGFFAEVRRKKADGEYKREISLLRLLEQDRQEEEERSTYYSVSDSPDDSPLPDAALGILATVKPKTRHKPFIQFATRVLNHLKAHDGIARLSQGQGFELLGYTNANQFTKYRDLLVKAGLVVLAQESVAHIRANTYGLTAQARELFGMTPAHVPAKARRVRYTDDEVIAALTEYP